MASRSPVRSSLRDLFGGSSSGRRRFRGKRPTTSFLAQFDGGDAAAGHPAAIRLVGFDTLEVRVMLAVTPAAETDFGFDGAGTITSYNGAGGDVVIPDTIGGTSVTRIGNSVFFGLSSLTSLRIPAGVTSIGTAAIASCTNLNSLELPSSVTSIGSTAFAACSSLKSIAIPAGVTSISDGTFYGCSGLTSLTIPAGVTSIGNTAFFGCSGLTSLAIPAGVTSIGNGAFNGCSGLTSLTIPKDVTSINNRLFYGCSGLTSLYFLGDAPKSVGTVAFYGVSATIYYLANKTEWNSFPFNGLTGVQLFENVEYTSDNFNCSIANDAITITGYTGSVTDVTIPATIFGLPVTSIGYTAFQYSGLTSLAIPSSVTSIGSYAFNGCSGLTSLTIPAGVTSIGNGAFANCSGLTGLAIPAGVTSIGNGAFYGCRQLTAITVESGNQSYKVVGGLLLTADGKTLMACPASKTGAATIPVGVTSIDDFAFFGCSGLTSLAIPVGVTSIGDNAFLGCSGLTSLEIPSSVTSIGNNAFNGCSGLTSLTIPAGVATIGNGAFYGCRGVTSITIPAGVTTIGNYAFQGCRSLTSLAIPAGVTTIGDSALQGCSGLTSLTIPAGVTTIGNSAFQGCSGLTSLTIPAGVTSIGSTAFFGCSGLTSLAIPAGVTSIGDFAFANCNRLTAITVESANQSYKIVGGLLLTADGKTLVACPGGKTGAATIPAGVTSIGNGAFSGCSGLMSLAIPNSVTSIGNDAFTSCSGLTSLAIPAGVTSISDSAFLGCSGLTSLAIPAGVMSIGSFAFQGCSGLTSLAIPSSVTSIGYAAFNGCSKLTAITVESGNPSYQSLSGLLLTADAKTLVACPGGTTGAVTIPAGVTSIGDNAFFGCSGLTSLAIPSSVTSIGYAAFNGCSKLTAITVESGNPSYQSLSGLLLTADGKTLVACPGGTTGAVTIPAGVTSIGDNAFFGCSGLTSLAIPSSVTSIGYAAFNGCSKLTAITVESGNPNYQSLSGLLLTADGKTLVACPGGNTGAVTIPAGVTSIGYNAFAAGNKLTAITVESGNPSYQSLSGLLLTADGKTLVACPGGTTGAVTIPAGVTSIGTYAFVGCSGLTSLYFLSNAPSNDPEEVPAFDGVPATIYYPAGNTGWPNSSYSLPQKEFAVSLSSASIAENNLLGAVVGPLSTNDPNAGNSPSYTLVAGDGSADNGSFSIDGNKLKATSRFNYEFKNSYTVRVRCEVPGGLATEKQFAITVTNVAEPATAPTVVVPATFTVVEDTPTSLTFTGTPFADADSPATKAMTVTLTVTGGTIAATAAGGVTVAGTATARTFTGTIASLNTYFTTANRIIYKPVANSTVSRTLTTKIAEVYGPRTLSSSAASTIQITPVNDAPIVSAPVSFTVTEDVKGNLVWPAASTPFADIDSPSLTVTLAVADGTITAASTAAVTVGGTATARTFTGTPAGLNTYFKTLGKIGYTTAHDNTIARTLTTTVSDGVLSASKSTRIAITPVNDAPTINPAARLVGGVTNTPVEMTYDTLRTALNVADVDTASPSIVIQAVNSGSLQKWSGTAWVNVSTAATAALAQRTLSAGQKIRWVPAAGVSGDQLAFKVKARDGSLSSAVTAQVTVNLALE